MAVQARVYPAGRPEETSRPALAALVTFLVCLLVVFIAAFITAPTSGIPILPLGPYVTEVVRTGLPFVLAGVVLGALLGLIGARMVYRVWGERNRRQDFVAGYLFLAPYLVITLIFTVGVLLFALYIAFYRYDIYTEPQWAGLRNFTQAFQTRDFLQSLVNVLWYSIIVTPLQTAGAILLAVLLNARMRAKEFFRTVFYLPSVTSSVVISMIFWWLYLRTGYLNFFVANLLGAVGIHFVPVEWLNDPRGLFQLVAGLFGGNIPSSQWYVRGPSVTLMAIMFQNIFTTIPTFMIMFLAALQDIPGSLYEAASIDGATGWTQFSRITLPLLRPVILLVVVLGTIGTLQIFDQVKILTSGGPLGTTLTPVYLVYREALGTSGQIQMGYAAAMAFILAIIIFAFTFIQRRFIEGATEQY